MFKPHLLHMQLSSWRHWSSFLVWFLLQSLLKQKHCTLPLKHSVMLPWMFGPVYIHHQLHSNFTSFKSRNLPFQQIFPIITDFWYPLDCLHRSLDSTGFIMLIGLILVGFSFKFSVLIPRSRLNWKPVSFCLHIRHIASHRITWSIWPNILNYLKKSKQLRSKKARSRSTMSISCQQTSRLTNQAGGGGWGVGGGSGLPSDSHLTGSCMC